MASIIKRKRNNRTTYLAFVRRKGVKAIVKSFYNKTYAKKFARAMERKLDTGDFSDIHGDLVDWRDRCNYVVVLLSSK